MIYESATDVRDLALRLVSSQSERGKLDFKRDLVLATPAQKVEFCKDLSAIANTDDDRLDGHGFIIVGAERGKLLGGVTAWDAAKADSFAASLTTIAKDYLAPVPAFTFLAFQDADLGTWGVVVVPPSHGQPHIIIKEYAGNPPRHDWFVRVNDITEKAGVLDYARVLQKAVQRATRPLETEVQRLSLRLERLEDDRLSSADLLEALTASNATRPRGRLKKSTTSETVTRSDDAAGLSSQLRRELSTPQSRVEELLAEEALRMRALMSEHRTENPQRFESDNASELLKPITYMESTTREFAQAIATIARHDSSLRFVDALVQAFEIIAEQPSLVGPHWTYAEDLRLYPLLLALYSLAFVSASRNDGRLLRRVLDCEFRIDRRDRAFPLIYAVRSARSTKDFFNQATQQRYFEPISMRLASVVQAWCGSLIASRVPEDVFYQAEFAFALEHMRLTTVFQGGGMPLSGAFLYAHRGQSAILSMLRRHSPFLVHLFGDELQERLKLFDQNVSKIISRDAFDRPFSKSVVAAWSNDVNEEQDAD